MWESDTTTIMDKDLDIISQKKKNRGYYQCSFVINLNFQTVIYGVAIVSRHFRLQCLW